MRRSFLSVAALTVLLAACSKDDHKYIGGKFLQSRASDEDSLIFDYDDEARMSALTYITLPVGSTSPDYTRVQYANGVLTALLEGNLQDAPVKSEDFAYRADGKLRRVNHYEPGETTAYSYDSVKYDGNGRITGYLVVNAADDKIAYEHQFVWDGNGNVITHYEIRFNDGIETLDTAIMLYAYDDKRNILTGQQEYYLINFGDASALSAHNVITSSQFSKPLISQVTNEFTYDSDGYPLTQRTRVVVQQNGEVSGDHTENYRFNYIRK